MWHHMKEKVVLSKPYQTCLRIDATISSCRFRFMSSQLWKWTLQSFVTILLPFQPRHNLCPRQLVRPASRRGYLYRLRHLELSIFTRSKIPHLLTSIRTGLPHNGHFSSNSLNISTSPYCCLLYLAFIYILILSRSLLYMF